MLLSLAWLILSVTMTTSITPVPGTIHVQLLPDNQLFNESYRPSAVVHYSIRFDGVPIDDLVRIGVEIRGSNPTGGPRGYITTARETTSIKDILSDANARLRFKLQPREIFAGYSWFLRPFLFFANESLVSTNMMNSGASKMFTVLKK